MLKWETVRQISLQQMNVVQCHPKMFCVGYHCRIETIHAEMRDSVASLN